MQALQSHGEIAFGPRGIFCFVRPVLCFSAENVLRTRVIQGDHTSLLAIARVQIDTYLKPAPTSPARFTVCCKHFPRVTPSISYVL